MSILSPASLWQSTSLFLGSAAIYYGFTATSAFAQPITAAGDGTGTQVQQQGDTFNISGGTQSGTNQFHSFEQFGLEQQQTANFQTEAGTANVLGRVTGGDPSVINGTVQVTGSEANLYLMNPAGMVFGENARLDVPGSFHGTTADSIGFENGEFSATGQNNYQDLNSAPNRFNFEAGSNGAIVNQGNLAVTEGKNVSLTGSTVINTGTLTAPGGQAAVIAAPTDQGSQSVRITQNGMVMGLEVGADRLSQQNLNATDLTQNPQNLPKVLTGGAVDHATALRVVDGRVYLLGSGMAIDPLTGSAVVAGEVSVGGSRGAGQVLVQADRVQVTGATLEATSQGSARSQIEILGTQRSQVQDSRLNLSNLVVIGGLLKIQAESVDLRASTIVANGVQGGGVIQLHATQGLSYLENSVMTALGAQGRGGRVEVLGDRVEILASTIDASGVAGGEIYVGGDYQGGGMLQTAQETVVDAGSLLRAEGLGWSPTGLPLPSPESPSALGGRVIVWADDKTRFYGVLKAKGAAEFSDSGFAEVSGKVSLDLGDRWDQRISVGELLLDPTNIAIATGGGTYGTTTISNYLNTTGNLILTTDIGGGQAGDITVGGEILWSSGNSLTLRADRSISFNAGAKITATGGGSIILEANQGAAPATGTFNGIDLTSANALISTNSGDITLTGKGGTIGGGGSNGIYLLSGSAIQTTSGNITLNGQGQSPGLNNLGIRIEGAGTLITAESGSITLNGTGADNSSAQNGVVILTNAQVTSTGTGPNAATITMNGMGGNATGQGFHQGVRIFGGARVCTIDG
ncbi:MAG: filamentous hemagglutinin N-terminal domain-containing protein, partial [Prochlorothrix sp.]